MLSDMIYGIAFLHGLLALAGFTVYNLQARLIYRASPRKGVRPEELGLEDVEQVTIRADDGTDIVAWRMQPAEGMPTLLYYHGNFCNLVNRKERTKRFKESGYGLLMISFRGYGLTEGAPGEARNVADARAAYDFLIREGVKASDIIIYGESLGGAVGTQVAVDRPAAAMILEAPFTSLADMAHRFFPYLPVDAYLEDRYETIRHIRRVRTPVMVIHSLHDEFIPFEFGQRIFTAANNPKALHVMENVGHAGLFRAGGWKFIREFIEEIVPAARPVKVYTIETLGQDVQNVLNSELPLTPFGGFASPSVH